LENRGSSYPYFQSGEKVVSLAIHPPEVGCGTPATIIKNYYGALYAVKLADGELHRWFAPSELEPVNRAQKHFNLRDFARIIENNGHPPKIKKGMIVQIAKVIPKVYFYDLWLEDGKYHRWLTDFELTYPL